MCDCQKKCNCSQTKPVDLTKPVQTRDGRAVRIISTDRKGKFPVIALVQSVTLDNEAVFMYNCFGQFAGSETSQANLVNITVREKRFVNIYNNKSTGPLYPTLAEARNAITGTKSDILMLSYEDDKLIGAEVFK